MGAIVRRGAHTDKLPEGPPPRIAHLSKGRAVILCIPSIARRMKMICAALQAPQPPARTSTRTPRRTSTRTSFSQGRPLHLKWRAHHFASCAHHFVWSRTPFCQLRKSFGLEAHIILMRALACSSRTTLPAVTAHKPTLTTDHGLLTTDDCPRFPLRSLRAPREPSSSFCPPLSTVRRQIRLAVLA